MASSRRVRIDTRVGLLMAVSLWPLSLFFHLTRYGQYVTVTMQDGFFGIYLGGDCDVRNSWIFNNFVEPIRGSGGGAELPQNMTWEFYDPSVSATVVYWSEYWREGLFSNPRVLGLWLPEIGPNERGGYCYLVLPAWLPMVLASAIIALLIRKGKQIGAGVCEVCNYDLTGNVSGVCPECGAKCGTIRS